MICMCACTCDVCVYIYIWHDMYDMYKHITNPTTHDDFYTVGHYWILRLSKKTTRTCNPQISWGSVSLCFCRLDGFTVSVFLLKSTSVNIFSTPIYEFYPIACWNMKSLSYQTTIKKPSSTFARNLHPPGCNLMPTYNRSRHTHMLWVCNLW